MAEYDMIQKAPHYNMHPSGVECIDVVMYLDFCSGSAIKYLWRGGLKGQALLPDDLRKAAYYVRRIPSTDSIFALPAVCESMDKVLGYYYLLEKEGRASKQDMLLAKLLRYTLSYQLHGHRQEDLPQDDDVIQVLYTNLANEIEALATRMEQSQR